MYGYIFWVIYESNRLKDKSEWLSRNNASGVVFFALFIHVVLVIQVVKAFYGRKTLPKYLHVNNAILTIIFLGSIYLVYLSFTKDRIAKLQRKYETKEGILTDNGALIVALLIFVPLVTVVTLGWTS